MLEAYILLANIEFLTLSDYDMCPTMADPRGATGVNAPLQKIQKNKFLVILKIFLPITMFPCVSYYYFPIPYSLVQGEHELPKSPYNQEFV